MKKCNEEFPLKIKEILGRRKPILMPDADDAFRHAGVLVPLLRENGACKVLFTKRTETVKDHKGQICFPGGSIDETDRSVKETALREAYEEIGLRREDLVILGRLDDALTLASNFVVHPFVGLITRPFEFRINASEVDKILEIPLDVFSPANGAKKTLFDFDGRHYPTPAYLFDGEVIWGATARIMENFMTILGASIG